MFVKLVGFDFYVCEILYCDYVLLGFPYVVLCDVANFLGYCVGELCDGILLGFGVVFAVVFVYVLHESGRECTTEVG